MMANTRHSIDLQHRPVFHLFQAMSSSEEKHSYKNQLQVVGTWDPPTASTTVFLELKTATYLPELHFGDVYIRLVENPSYTCIPLLHTRMKACKSADSYMCFQSGWINNAVFER